MLRVGRTVLAVGPLAMVAAVWGCEPAPGATAPGSETATSGPGASSGSAATGASSGSATSGSGGATTTASSASNATASSASSAASSGAGGDILLLGDDKLEAGEDSHGDGLADASQFTAVASGNVTSITVYLSGGTTQKLVVALYTNQNTGGSDHAYLRLAQATITLPALGWNTVAVAPAPVEKGKPYWIAMVSPLGLGGFKFPFTNDAKWPLVSEHSLQKNLTDLPMQWSPAGPNDNGYFPNTRCSFYASGH